MKDGLNFEIVTKAIKESFRWILLTVVLFIVFGGAYYFYKYSGYKEYRAAISYINGLNDNQKTAEYNRFFAVGQGENMYGGILAGIWKNRLFMWGADGLKYYTVGDYYFSPNTILYYVNGGCLEALTEIMELNNAKSKDLPKSRLFENIITNPYIEHHLHMYKWQALVHPGNYIQVVTDENGSDLVSAVVLAEFSAPNNWIICNVSPVIK